MSAEEKNPAVLSWVLHDDGSFDLCTKDEQGQESVAMRRGYPSRDGSLFRPISVRVSPGENGTGGQITYSGIDIVLSLVFAVRSDGVATLDCSLSCDGAVPADTICPIGVSTLTGVTDVFTVNDGFVSVGGAATGRDAKTLHSATLTALVAGDGTTVVVSPIDYSRFACRFTLDTAPEPSLRVGFGLERIEFPVCSKISLPTLHFYVGGTPDVALRTAAAATAREMQARPLCDAAFPTSYHWCSWYYEYQHLTEEKLGDYLRGFVDKKVPLTAVQLDVGYSPHIGDWLENGFRYPSGLEGAFGQITGAGYRPGIWIAPFMVGSRSRLATEHPEWLLRNHSGEPINPWNMRFYGEERLWGYQDEEYYVLDTSHPEAFAYLRSVFRTFREWGARFFKTDFMHWGLQPSSTVCRHTSGKTSVEYFRDLLTMIREEIGEDSYWLGCIAPFEPFIGFADGMRIGGDVGPVWQEGFGPLGMLRSSLNTQFFNGIWWQNDPDAILLRDFHIRMTGRETVSLALWQGMLGGVVCTSDPLHKIPEAHLALWKFLRPRAGVADVSYAYRSGSRSQGIEGRFLLLSRDSDAVGGALAKWVLMFNATAEHRTECHDLPALLGGAVSRVSVYDPMSGKQSTIPADDGYEKLPVSLDAHDCVLLLVLL